MSLVCKNVSLDTIRQCRIELTEHDALQCSKTDRLGNTILPFYIGQTRSNSNTLDSKSLIPHYPEHPLEFKGVLYPEQDKVQSQALKMIQETNCVCLCMMTGFGKTIVALSIISQLKRKCLIIVHRTVLIQQWKDQIKKYLGIDASVWTNSTTEPESLITIGMKQTVCKFQHSFQSFGTVCYDEIHDMCSPTGIKLIQLVRPEYWIGLTASPQKRYSNIYSVLKLYFGPQFIEKMCPRKVCVYKIETGISIPYTFNIRNEIQWTRFIQDQCEHKDRNELILEWIKKLSTRWILILTKRVQHVELLVQLIHTRFPSIECASFTRNQSLNKNAQILVSTVSKSGVGMDHPRLDTLIVACDMDELFCQYAGRILRQNHDAIIVDLVDKDKYHILNRHWNHRFQYYQSIHALVQTIYPNSKMEKNQEKSIQSIPPIRSFLLEMKNGIKKNGSK